MQGCVRRQPDGVRLVRIVRPQAELPPQTQLDGFGGPQRLSESCQLPNHVRVPLQERCLRPQQGQIKHHTLRHWERSIWPKVRFKIQIMFHLEGNLYYNSNKEPGIRRRRQKKYEILVNMKKPFMHTAEKV